VESVLTLIKKYYFVLNLAALTIGVFFVAQIISFQIGKQIRIPLQPVFAPQEVIFEKREPKGLEAYEPILTRNIFNLRPPPLQGGTVAPVKEIIPIRLLGTVAGEETYAFIEDPYQKVQRIFRLDDMIAPGIQLVEIGRNEIAILRDGEREVIEISSVEGAGRLPSAPFSPAASANVPPSGSILVDKREMEAVTQDLNRLMTQARLVPNFSGGVADGFRIFSIVPGSLYERAGLRNGDIIQNINGMELKEPEKAFQIYQMLKDNDRFTIDLIRAGQKMSLNYEIR
jgi:general secretion pathway protein C